MCTHVQFLLCGYLRPIVDIFLWCNTRSVCRDVRSGERRSFRRRITPPAVQPCLDPHVIAMASTTSAPASTSSPLPPISVSSPPAWRCSWMSVLGSLDAPLPKVPLSAGSGSRRTVHLSRAQRYHAPNESASSTLYAFCLNLAVQVELV